MNCNIWWSLKGAKVRLSEEDLRALHALRRGELKGRRPKPTHPLLTSEREQLIWLDRNKGRLISVSRWLGNASLIGISPQADGSPVCAHRGRVSSIQERKAPARNRRGDAK
jgi:hypothetical protein